MFNKDNNSSSLMQNYMVTNLCRDAEAAGPKRDYRDKNLEAVMEKINDGIDELVRNNPGMPRHHISNGLRGTKYYIEFPFGGPNIDSLTLFKKVENLIESNKKKFGVKVVHKDSFMGDGKIAYLVDYSVTSSMILGT
jgi:hypothetical protein